MRYPFPAAMGYTDPMSDESKPPHEPTDYRRLRKQTDRNLAIAVVLLLVGGGGALIALIYGPGASMLGVVCLLGGAGTFGLLWAILVLMERWANR